MLILGTRNTYFVCIILKISNSPLGSEGGNVPTLLGVVMGKVLLLVFSGPFLGSESGNELFLR